MLKSLYISSFVLIDEVYFDIDDHFTVMTGETGAGKSIIVDAIGQLTGQRASSQFVQKGKDKAIIEGIFDVDNNELEELFHELHIPYDNEIIIHKEILSNGKSSIKINYRPTTNNALKMIAPYLIHIHSQFDTQVLLSKNNHIHLLDQYIGQDIQDSLNNYQNVYQQYLHILKDIKTIEEEDYSDEMIEFYQTQYKELKDFSYTEEDIENIEEEIKLLKNSEKLFEIKEHYAYEMNDGILDHFHNIIDDLESINDLITFKDHYDNMYNFYYQLMDIHEDIMNDFSHIYFDEYRYNELQEELYDIQRLQKKYGYSVERILEAKEDLERKIDASLHRDELLSELYSKKDSILKDLDKCANQLYEVRKRYALILEKDIQKQLEDLYLNDAKLRIEFVKGAYSKYGREDVVFKVSMNKGQAFSVLDESASGGEMSRLILAILSLITENMNIDTLIFDEIDTGVSGKVAGAIGHKMKEIASNKQVLAITHLPQVVVFGTHHIYIEKTNNNDNTYTNIKILNDEERVLETARMLSGEQLSPQAIENAKILLKDAQHD